MFVQPTKAPVDSSREQSPEEEPAEQEDVRQNGYEGDMEDDDEELSFDFRKKAVKGPEELFHPHFADTEVQLNSRWFFLSPFSYFGRYDSSLLKGLRSKHALLVQTSVQKLQARLSWSKCKSSDVRVVRACPGMSGHVHTCCYSHPASIALQCFLTL